MVGAAVRQRLGGWARSSVAVGVVLAMLVLARQVRPVVAELVWSWRFDEPGSSVVGAVGWARLVGWALVVAALCVGRARLGAVGAIAAVAAEGAVALGVGVDPAAPGWHLMLALVVAALLSGALLVGFDAVGVPARSWMVMAVLGVGLAAGAAGGPLVASQEGEFVVVATGSLRWIGVATLAVAAMSVVAVWCLTPATRRQAWVLLASVAALLGGVQLGYDNAFAAVVARQALVASPGVALGLAGLAAAVVFGVGVGLLGSRGAGQPL